MIWRQLRATWTRFLLIAVVLASAGGLAVVAFWPATVSLAEVSRRDITPAVQGVGTVEVKVVVQVSSKITGRIVAVLVDQGDVVEIGQVLVRLDEAQLRADLQRSEAALRAAEAHLRDLEAGSRAEEIAEARANLARAEAQLNDLLAGSRAPEIEELQERVRSASATRVLAERELKRIEQLHAKELVAAQEHDRARQGYDVAVAQERAAQQTLQLAIEGARKDQIGRTRLGLPSRWPASASPMPSSRARSTPTWSAASSSPAPRSIRGRRSSRSPIQEPHGSPCTWTSETRAG